MAANPKVNASVEQANVSTGWDEAKAEEMAELLTPVPVPNKIPADIEGPKPDISSISTISTQQAWKRLLNDIGQRTKLLARERPQLFIAGAGVIGLALGIWWRAKGRKYYA